MAFLNTILPLLGSITETIAVPNKPWHWFILQVFGFVSDYGWRIVVFTVLLKLVLSPLDFYQRYKMHKNQKITERLKPTMEKLQKQYAGDKQAFSQKQMELNRKEGYSYFSSCLPMILTMVIFITLWLSMQTIAGYMTLRQYTTMYDTYESVKTQVIELSGESIESPTTATSDKAREIGQDVVYHLYYDGIDDEYVQKVRTDHDLPDAFALENSAKLQASWLWIENIWAPDIPWGNRAILDYSSFESILSNNYKKQSVNGFTAENQGLIFDSNTYNEVMAKLLNDTEHRHVNGYLVLPVLVVLLSVASQLISMFQQKKAGQVNEKGGAAMSMKVMMFIMPLMMAFFAVQYASIFTLYMTMNSACTLFFNFTFTGLINLMDKRRQSRRYGIKTGSTRGYIPTADPAIVHYVKGANPHAGERVKPEPVTSPAIDKQPQDKNTADRKSAGKNRKVKSGTVKKSGRPDPRELMNMDVDAPGKSKK